VLHSDNATEPARLLRRAGQLRPLPQRRHAQPRQLVAQPRLRRAPALGLAGAASASVSRTTLHTILRVSGRIGPYGRACIPSPHLRRATPLSLRRRRSLLLRRRLRVRRRALGRGPPRPPLAVPRLLLPSRHRARGTRLLQVVYTNLSLPHSPHATP
jgi:hypothetical protein